MNAQDSPRHDVIEVVAQFDGSILDVQHLAPPRADARAQAHKTRALLAGGGAALGLALLLFPMSTRVSLPRAFDLLAALLISVGTWLLLRGLDRATAPVRHEYTVGEDTRASCVVAPGALPSPRLALVQASARGWELQVTPTMTGELTLDGATLPLADAAARGLSRPSPTLPTAQVMTLPAGARAWLGIGNATFTISHVSLPRLEAAPGGIDWGRELYTGGVALVVSAFVFLLYSLPPQPQSLALDQERTQQLAHFILTPPEPPLPPPMASLSPSSGGRGSAPAKGPSGAIGKPSGQHASGVLHVQGHSHDDVKRIAGALAQHAGVVDLIGGTQVGQVFPPDTPLGGDRETILNNLRGDLIADAYGHGLDLVGRGDGPGGGGDGHTIGVGRLSTIGDCPTCSDGRNRYGTRPPSTRMVHVAKAPDVIPGAASVVCGVNGACLDKEIVRRIVHHHHSEVRFCYEKQLLTHSEISGRVVTQFTIAATGKVLSSVVTESSVRDHDIEQCIVQAVRRWEFPQSGQTSIVTYPFILQSAQR
jgi:hypothetical protein